MTTFDDAVGKIALTATPVTMAWLYSVAYRILREGGVELTSMYGVAAIDLRPIRLTMAVALS